MNSSHPTRRRFAIWIGLGMCSLGHGNSSIFADTLQENSGESNDSVEGFDGESIGQPGETVQHWTAVRNSKWRWYEREDLINGIWKTTGITTPIIRETGLHLVGVDGYIDERDVPSSVLDPLDRIRLDRDNSIRSDDTSVRDSASDRQMGVSLVKIDRQQPGDESVGFLDPETMPILVGDLTEPDAGRSSDERRNRHGRPPSEWLRSLSSKEISAWLSQVEIQDAHVRGMTFWTHLTRDHAFDPDNLTGLTEAELAELHGAAHEGF